MRPNEVEWGHTFKAFIIIKTPSYLFKINKRTNGKYHHIYIYERCFLASRYFFYILLAFVSFLQTYYDICFFHILSLYFFLLQIILYIYFLLFLLIILCYFHTNLLLCLVSHLCFFHNKLFDSSFIYNEKKIIMIQFFH